MKITEEEIQRLRERAAYHRVMSVDLKSEKAAKIHYEAACELHQRIKTAERRAKNTKGRKKK